MKFSTKIFLMVLIIGLAIVGCQNQEINAALDSDEVILTITNAEKSVSLTYADFANVGMVSGYGGFKTTTDRISGPNQYSGVTLLDLIQLVNMGDEAVSVQVEASDGYAITFSSDQLKDGNYIAYNPTTGEQIHVDGLRTILAAQKDGKLLDVENDGHLRLHIISEKPEQVTDGHWSVKFINQIKVKPLLQEWTLSLEGALNEVIDRATFEAGTAEKCHQVIYIDSMANEWEGIPLWLLVGKVDDEITHEEGAFNDALAERGYEVEVVSKSGKSTTFTSQDVMRNNKILVVYLLNDNPLTDADFPLRLIGEDINKENEIVQIESIILHLP